MASIMIFIGCLLLQLLIVSGCIWLMSRWMKSQVVSFPRAIGVAIVVWVYSLIGSFLGYQMADTLPPHLSPNEAMLAVFLSIMILLGILFFSLLFIRYAMKLPTLRSTAVLGACFVGSALWLAGMWYGVRPYVIESFVTTSNSMAPALVGNHRVAACPECAQTVMIPSSKFGFDEEQGICDHCMKVNKITSTSIFTDVLPPDRIYLNRLLSPKRWDLVVFQSKDDPAVKLVMRLVALPGETIVLKAGKAWIDGKQYEPPAAVGAIRYSSEPFSQNHVDTESKPLKLRPDECYVLGDYSVRSYDSRAFGPVKWNSIEGVVDLIYWPMKRFRVLR